MTSIKKRATRQPKKARRNAKSHNIETEQRSIGDTMKPTSLRHHAPHGLEKMVLHWPTILSIPSPKYSENHISFTWALRRANTLFFDQVVEEPEINQVSIDLPSDVKCIDSPYISGKTYTFKPIPPTLKQLAFMYAFAIRKKKGQKQDHESSTYQKYYELQGKIGELAVGHMLFGHYATAFRNLAIGYSDTGDFDFKGKVIDVKTAGYPVLKVYKSQLAKKDMYCKCCDDCKQIISKKRVDYYVAVMVEPDSPLKERIENNWHNTNLVHKMLGDMNLPVFNKVSILGYLPRRRVKELIKNGQAVENEKHYEIAVNLLRPIVDLESQLAYEGQLHT